MNIDPEKLIAAALAAREKASAPYSKFKVGAAVLASTGEIFEGCNIESSSYGLTICAERVAIFKAVSEGAHAFEAIAVVADTDKLTTPCGACRQVIWENCGNVFVHLANLHGLREVIEMKELLPMAFDDSFLD